MGTEASRPVWERSGVASHKRCAEGVSGEAARRVRTRSSRCKDGRCVRSYAEVTSFPFASRATGIFFLAFSVALLLFAPTWVEHYIALQDQWPVATDMFRLVAAADLMVGALLVAISSGQLPWGVQRWISFGMSITLVTLTAVHVFLLAYPGGPPLWQPMLYFDTALFGSLSAYWIAVTVVSARRGHGAEHSA